MKAAILDTNSIVTNIAKVDDEQFANSQGWIVIDGINSPAKIGDEYDVSTGVFTSPPPPPEPVPSSISRRQAKQQLLIDNLLSNVQPTIDAIVDATERQMVQIYWDDAQEFERNHSQLIALATAMGLNSTQLDTMFKEANKL